MADIYSRERVYEISKGKNVFEINLHPLSPIVMELHVPSVVVHQILDDDNELRDNFDGRPQKNTYGVIKFLITDPKGKFDPADSNTHGVDKKIVVSIDTKYITDIGAI